MTQEHREQFLATEGWQQTERGHIRVETFFAVPDYALAPPLTRYYITSFQARKPVQFRRFPFGRQPKHDALVGWFDLGDKLLKRGGLRELNEVADRASRRSLPVQEYQQLVVHFWSAWKPRNKRQGWKTIEVGDGEKKEKVVVEVEL